jgi:hypothetical protein
MTADESRVVALRLHPDFQERQRVQELKATLMTDSQAYVQVALDNAAVAPQAVRILKRACELLDEALDQLVWELCQ